MEIGSYDIYLTVKNSITTRQVAELIIKSFIESFNWSEFVLEPSEFKSCPNDFFLYKDQQSLEERGNTENTMIYFIFSGTDGLTLISDKEHHEHMTLVLKDNEYVIIMDIQ
jgi:hypothetical protein